MTAGGEAMVPASPMPLTPSGFVGLGVQVLWSSKLRQLGRARHHVARHGALPEVALLVVGGLLEEGLGDALGHAAVHLALDHQRVDDCTPQSSTAT